jgi:hypothetical protein
MGAMKEEALELIADMAEASRDLVKVWGCIEKMAPRRRYGHLIERHQALVDRAEGCLKNNVEPGYPSVSPNRED